MLFDSVFYADSEYMNEILKGRGYPAKMADRSLCEKRT